MKVSLATIAYLNTKYSIGYDPFSIPLEELLVKIGTQLGAVEEVEDWGPRYDGIIVVKVVSCEKHADADKLSVCRIDDGGVAEDVERGPDGLVQVVCGAPNVQAGMTVAWLPPGSTVPSSVGKDLFVLEARTIRGIVSNGMLASAQELAISDDHDGILEITPEDVGEELMKPGTPFKKLYGLDDVIVDMENKMFTHRPDGFGILGVARELAGIQGLAFKSPDWYREPVKMATSDNSLPLSIKNEALEVVPRFMAQAVADVSAHASPIWLRAGLTRVGIRPINILVDLTNYYMQLTGQPLHAFDYDKVKALSNGTPTIMPRMANEGEELTLLGGKKVKLTKDDIVIATDKQAIGLAGVMGGAETEVDENTRNIVIEAATFDMYTIRHTAMRHGLFTDAVTRFTKGQSPLQNDRVLAKIVEDMVALAGGKPASEVFDLKTDVVKPMEPVTVGADFVNTRLGSSLSVENMKTILENVEFAVTLANESLTVTPPFWRRDIEIPEDIIEEVGRLYGYDKLPVELPSRPGKPALRNPQLDLKQSVRNKLAAAGASELVTYSFVHGDLLSKTEQDPEKAFHLRNALSPDLQFYRLSLTPSLLDKVQQNIRADIVRGDDNEFALFELGRIHMKGQQDKIEPEIPKEDSHLAFVFVADQKTADRKYSGSPTYQAKKYLSLLLPGEGTRLVPLQSFDFKGDEWGMQMVAPYEPARSGVIVQGGVAWGIVGEFKNSVKKVLKLPDYSAGFELATELLEKQSVNDYVPLPTFPKVVQDVSLRVPQAIAYGDLYNFIWEKLQAAQKEHGYFPTLGPLDIYEPEAGETKNIAFRLWLSHYERTLKAEEVNTLLDNIASAAKEKFGAERL